MFLCLGFSFPSEDWSNWPLHRNFKHIYAPVLTQWLFVHGWLCVLTDSNLDFEAWVAFTHSWETSVRTQQWFMSIDVLGLEPCEHACYKLTMWNKPIKSRKSIGNEWKHPRSGWITTYHWIFVFRSKANTFDLEKWSCIYISYIFIPWAKWEVDPF